MCTQVMPLNLRLPVVWELLNQFKGWCQLKGWRTSEQEDWVKTSDNKYHNFLWAQTVHPSTFRKIVANPKCAVRNDVSYQVVDVSYTAWLFSHGPHENLMEIVKENLELSRRTAIYTLSWAYTGKSRCLKLNKTDSIVFKEFERFLETKLGLKVELPKLNHNRENR